eukprot:GEMP01036835.1.p1 GENE.GEMP01036835.1~~GEMP01036835.1.p1  ORF type:complete len:259 (+),score=49.49 GEMP01036835.1:232-1008(+)
MSSRPRNTASPASKSPRSPNTGSPRTPKPETPDRPSGRPSGRPSSRPSAVPNVSENIDSLNLFYHNAGGAESIKFALQISGVPFEEQKLGYEDWQKMNSLGPVLIVNKRKIKQSQAILRFIGKLNNSGLYPTDPREAMIMDELVDLVRDLRSRIGSMKYGTEEQKAEKCSNVIDCLIPDLFEKIDDRVENSPTGFLFGKEITVADLEVASMSTFVTKGTIEGVPKNILDPFPNVLRVHYNVMRHPKISRNKARCGDSP